MLTGKKLLIFDMDGTLIDSVGVWNEVDCAVISSIRRDGRTELVDIQKNRDEALARYKNCESPYLAYYAWLKEKYNAAESAEEIGALRRAKARVFIEHKVDYKPFAADVIKKLHSLGYTLAIASTTRRENMEIYKNLNQNIISKARLCDYFSAIYTHEDAANIKPSPDIHIRLMSEFGVSPNECLIFEDSLVGVLAAKAAGIPVCLVYDKYSEHDRDKMNELADYIINDFSEVLNNV